ncbi:hypothetical protein ALC56_03021 [Trachymyrmex septentrionalis]|uniref:DNA-directed DNA polymerase n=1 Tax=Trachymyrmex septentrionalis TaxID=34720 RepID=A0A151K060_9HYME|nr:hypothetical protein ALC56_03021 [Trachymyrmex septentrionalis]
MIKSNHIEPRQFLEDAGNVVLERVRNAEERYVNVKVNTPFNGEFTTKDKHINKSIITKNSQIYRCTNMRETERKPSYPHYTVLNLMNIMFPMTLKDISKFERLNARINSTRYLGYYYVRTTLLAYQFCRDENSVVRATTPKLAHRVQNIVSVNVLMETLLKEDSPTGYSLIVNLEYSRHLHTSTIDTSYLRDYIELNIQCRTRVKNDFEKYLYKLMNNAVFGKTMKKISKHVDVKLITK